VQGTKKAGQSLQSGVLLLAKRVVQRC